MAMVFDSERMWRIDGADGCSLMAPEERNLLLESLGDGRAVMEIGSFHGATAAWLAQQRESLYVVAIDNFTQNQDPQAIDRWLENYRRFPGQMNLWVGTATDWLISTGCIARFDLVLVDGGHSYEDCRDDLIVAHVVVRRRGAIAVHDYGVACFPGIERAVEKIRNDPNYRWKEVGKVRNLIVFGKP